MQKYNDGGQIDYKNKYFRQNKVKQAEIDEWVPKNSNSPDLTGIQYPSAVQSSKQTNNVYSKLSVAVARGHGKKSVDGGSNMNRTVNLEGTGNLKSVIFPDGNENQVKEEVYFSNYGNEEKSMTEARFERKQQLRSRGKFRNSRGPLEGQRQASSMTRKLDMLSSQIQIA